ncbi:MULTISPECIES: portal protein [unclassified Bradyrhizobium]|uniref:portal protein n=1 Tax=unclassified Bradyrhizobium TaxID=2631580 RepID=UPI002FF03441
MIDVDNGNEQPRYQAPSADRDSALIRRRQEFEDYATSKPREIDEQRMSWRYYHIDQWSAEQIKVLKKRHQPIITFDRTARKIDSLAGTIRRLRTDPKAYPNTPKGEQGAEVATQVIRTICDGSFVEDIEVECCKDALIHGIGVDELVMETGDKGDPDLRFEYVDPRTFFYDPRSMRHNFQDVKFHGVYKWADIDELDLLVEGASEKVKEVLDNDGGYWTAFDTDRETMWVDSRNRVRLIDHWYKSGSIWKWCLHTGNVELMSGDSPFRNERGMSISKYHAFAAMIDIDGDHYGFIRRLRGPQDAMNQHRSKAMHLMNTRQVKLKEGAVDDVEVTRREAARPDGTLVYRGDKNDLEILQPDQEFLQQTNYYNDAKTEIDTFGPNQQLIQEFGQNVSGRAANMLQQAGLAELGPVLKNFRMWKLGRYRAAWVAAQTHWTAERMLRVSGDENAFAFMQINGVGLNEFGMPVLVNMLGNIDVEIKVDEGPDTETIMGDIFDLLMALSQNNVPVPPAAIIEASYLPLSEKKKLIQMVSQPDPARVAAMEAQIGKTQAEAQKLGAEAGKAQTAALLNIAKAQTEGMPDGPPPPKTPLDVAEQIANINEKNATAAHKTATAENIRRQAMISPLKLLAENAQKNADRMVNSAHKNADRITESRHRNADRTAQRQQRNATPV